MKNIFINKAAREAILAIYNAGLEVPLFNKVSPKAVENMAAFMHSALAKASIATKKKAERSSKGSVITLENLLAPSKKPNFKTRTVAEEVTDHTQAQISVIENLSRRVRELEKGQQYMMGLLSPKFQTDRMSTKELFSLTAQEKSNDWLTNNVKKKA
jgi:hypothetical protein